MSSLHTNKPSIAPAGVTTFEHVVQHLHLSPKEYTSSAELKEWVRKHKDEKYVPPQLLDLWGFEVNMDFVARSKKPPKRAA